MNSFPSCVMPDGIAMAVQWTSKFERHAMECVGYRYCIKVYQERISRQMQTLKARSSNGRSICHLPRAALPHGVFL